MSTDKFTPQKRFVLKKIINEIDLDLNEGDIVRSHRVGKPKSRR